MVCIFVQGSFILDCIIAWKIVYWVLVNEDRDMGLRVEHETHKHNKLFSEDPNTSNVLNVILRCSTLLRCDLFPEKVVQENTVVQGTVRNELHGRKSFLTAPGRNEPGDCPWASQLWECLYTHGDGHVLQKDILPGVGRMQQWSSEAFTSSSGLELCDKAKIFWKENKRWSDVCGTKFRLTIPLTSILFSLEIEVLPWK